MEERGLLERYGAWIASAFGGFALLGAAVFAARWAIREGLLGGHPEVGLAIGMIVGCGGMLGAEVAWARGARALGAGLAGSGLGIVYFSLYSAHAWYDLLGMSLTSVALLSATSAGALQAIRRDSELTAVLGFVGGMITPVLLGARPGPYLAYLAAINVAVAAAALWRGWKLLPWFGVGSTLLLGLSWALSAAVDHSELVSCISVSVVSLGYAAIAAHPEISPVRGLPWLFGAAAGLLCAVMFAGEGPALVSAVLPLATLSLLLPLLRIAASRHSGDPGFVLVAMVHAVSCIAILALSARLSLGSGGTIAALALVALPATVSRAFSSLTDGDRWSTTVIWLASLCGAAVIALFGEVSHGWLIGLTIAATGRLIGSARESHREGVALSTFALGAATLCLLGVDEPLPVLVSGLVLFAISVIPSALLPSRDLFGYLPALVSPILLAPLMLAWQSLTGDGWLGVIPLMLGAYSAIWLLFARSPLWHSDEQERRLAISSALVLTVTFSTLALPAQLSAQWLTMGLAAEGAALLWAASRTKTPWLSIASILLLSLVTARLALNPAVLDYHLVSRPRLASWVWYGYGLPVLALIAAAHVRWVPAPLEQTIVRRGFEIAAIVVGFCGINLLVSHALSGGETLSLFDTSDAARASRTALWSAYGVVLLSLGGRKLSPWPRAMAGLVLLAAAALKLALWDLWLLDMLPSALALGVVALCAFAAAGLLGRAASQPRAIATEQP